jgi:transporter family-2 protein
VIQLATITLAIVAGILTTLQAPTNAILARAFGSPFSAALVSFLVGTLALLLFWLLLVPRPEPTELRTLPWYAWLGGLYGAFFVSVAAFATPRVGVAVFVTAAIAGQLAIAVLLDHVGALGLQRQPATFVRIIGVLMVLGGVLLVRRS